MHFSAALAAAAAVAPFVAAHAGPGSAIPQIIGLNVKDLKARSMLSNLVGRGHAAEVDHHGAHEKRQGGNVDGQCGDGVGTCAAGYCCSENGWCGNTADYCYSPGCNYKYGPGCPENVTPAGTNTSTVARTKLGSVAYGGDGIYDCVTAGTVAITYDDGPFANYTDHILDLFKSYNAKATFFITGNNINKGQIDLTAGYKASIQRMAAEGHQIASHTWTHLDLSAISSADRKDQMIKNEMAIRNIVGYFPTYMRPPYSSCTSASGCEADMATLGYHVTYFDVDTDDYDQDDPTKIQNSKDWFHGNITAGGATAADSDWLAIGHDIHAQTAYNLTDYMLSTLTTLGYKAVTVGECLGDPAANWYRSSAAGSVTTSTHATTIATSTRTSTAASASTSSSTKVSTDGTCGGTTGFTCLGSTFGNCCSSAGWCGSTTAYCGTGCQLSAGTCTGASSTAVVSSVRSSTVVSSARSSTVVSSARSSTVVSSVRSSTVSTVRSSTVVVASSTKTSSSAAATATKKVTTDATCGGTAGYTCQGSTFGNCCSSAGWCGSTTAYCGSGCQKSYGTCT